MLRERECRPVRSSVCGAARGLAACAGSRFSIQSYYGLRVYVFLHEINNTHVTVPRAALHDEAASSDLSSLLEQRLARSQSRRQRTVDLLAAASDRPAATASSAGSSCPA